MGNSKSEPPVEFRVLVEGLIAGMISGIAIRTGISVDESGIYLMILKTFCKATEGMPTRFDCWGYFALLSFSVIVITIFAIVAEVRKVDDWRIGVTLYGVGFLATVLLMVLV